MSTDSNSIQIYQGETEDICRKSDVGESGERGRKSMIEYDFLLMVNDDFCSSATKEIWPRNFSSLEVLSRR